MTATSRDVQRGGAGSLIEAAPYTVEQVCEHFDPIAAGQGISPREIADTIAAALTRAEQLT